MGHRSQPERGIEGLHQDTGRGRTHLDGAAPVHLRPQHRGRADAAPSQGVRSPRPNVLFYFAEQVGGPWVGYLMIIAVLSSTVADAQTTLLLAARVTLSMARDGVFPRVFGVIQGTFQTPMFGTLILASLAAFGIVLRAASPTINNGYGNLINNIGVLVAYYYGVTGMACAWSYRKVMFEQVRFLFTGVILPFLAGIFCFWVGYEVIRQSGLSASAPVLVAYFLGIP